MPKLEELLAERARRANELPRSVPGGVREVPQGATANHEPALDTSPEDASEVVVDQGAPPEDWDKDPSVVVELPTPRNTNAQLQPHQKHTLAMGLCQGLPIHELARLLRHTPQYIRRVVEQDPEVQNLYEHYHQVVLQATIERRVRLMELLPKADQVIQDGLVDADMKNRMAAARQLYDLVKAPEVGPKVEMNFNAGTVDPEQQKILNDAISGITKLINEVKDSGEVAPSYKKHLRTTLPGPEDVVGHHRRDS